MRSNNVLVIAPHTDDGEWGAGGTLAKLKEDGKDIFYAAFSSCANSLPDGLAPDTLVNECKAATSVLGIDELFIFDYEVRRFSYFRQEILEDMVKLKNKINPYLVLLPCSSDFHQDHSTIYNEGIRAFKGANLLGYELVWNTITMHTSFFSLLDEHHLQQKINAIMCYRSQESRNYHNEQFIRSLATTRGVQVNAKYAEAFELIRWIY
jgi:N-acetylglucosamine malate deacetylase 1